MLSDRLRGTLSPLRERDFRLFFAGRTISRLGASFSYVALAFAILELGGDASDVGIVLAGAPLPVVVVSAFVAGLGIELFGVFWELSLQQHIPGELLSRVFSYDILGSIALMPIGFLVVAPLSDVVGIHPTLWITAGAIVVLVGATLSVGDVRHLRRLETTPEPTGPLTEVV